MGTPPEFDPYQPPAVADNPIPEIQATGYLKDPSVVGNAALVAISTQVIVKFLMAIIGRGDWIMMLSIIHVPAYLGSVIFYLMWLHQVSSNALRMNPHAGITPGWAVGSYFIPLVNWVAPIVTLRSVIRITFDRKRSGLLPALVVVWWIAYWLSNLILKFGRDPVMFGLWGLFLVVAWGGVVVLVTRISRCQAELRPDESQRVRMTPLSASPRPVRVRRSRPSSRSVTPDIEAGWGGGDS